MSLTLSEFRRLTGSQPAPAKICGHDGCTKEIGPRVDGEHHKISGQPVCDDCYFDSFDDAIPVGIPGIRRR